MPNTENKDTRRDMTISEISVIKVCSQLLKTIEYNEYLSREQILKRVAMCYNELQENYFGQDEFLSTQFERYEHLQSIKIKEYMRTHPIKRE